MREGKGEETKKRSEKRKEKMESESKVEERKRDPRAFQDLSSSPSKGASLARPEEDTGREDEEGSGVAGKKHE